MVLMIQTKPFKRAGPSKLSESRFRGEEAAEELLRAGVGEEPTLALPPSHRHRDCRLSELFVLELFAGTDKLTKCLKHHGFIAFDKTSKRSEGQVILEADLSNKEEVESLLDFVRLKASHGTTVWNG